MRGPAEIVSVIVPRYGDLQALPPSEQGTAWSSESSDLPPLSESRPGRPAIDGRNANYKEEGAGEHEESGRQGRKRYNR